MDKHFTKIAIGILIITSVIFLGLSYQNYKANEYLGVASLVNTDTGSTSLLKLNNLITAHNSLEATTSMALVTSLPNLTGFLSLSSWFGTTTDILDEGSSNLYWTDNRFDARLGASTSLPQLATAANLTDIGTITKLDYTQASGTNETLSGSLWLTALGVPAGAVLAVDAAGKIIATTTGAGDLTTASIDTIAEINAILTGEDVASTSGTYANITAGKASALAVNPTDCSANQFANAIDTSGNLTCSSIPTITVNQGGTGLTSLNIGYIPFGGDTTTMMSSSALQFSGSTLTVTYASSTGITATNFYGNWAGDTIAVTKGGTGLTAIAAGGLLYGSAANTLSVLASSTAGKVLKIGSTGFPEWGDESVKTAGDYLTLTSQDMDIDIEVVTKAFEFVIATTTIATTSNYLSFQVPVALNITQVSGFCNGGTTTVAIDERAATTPKTAGADIFDSAFSIGDYKATTTFSNAGIASGAWVNLDIDGYFVGSPILCYLNIKGAVVD